MVTDRLMALAAQLRSGLPVNAGPRDTEHRNRSAVRAGRPRAPIGASACHPAGSEGTASLYSSLSYLNETFTFARYARTCPSSIWRSSSDTSAIRSSRRDCEALATAAAAALSQDSVLVPTNSMIL